MPFNLSQAHPLERKFYERGEKMFFYRAGPYDFSCASCHGDDGKRIRLQDLPVLYKNPGDGLRHAPRGRPTACRNGQMWTMQLRLNDCLRQQRFPYPHFGSDVTIDLIEYIGVNAKGAQGHRTRTQALKERRIMKTKIIRASLVDRGRAVGRLCRPSSRPAATSTRSSRRC